MNEVLIYSSMSSPIVALIIAGKSYQRLPRSAQYMYLLMGLSLLFDLTSFTLSKLGIPNLHIINLYLLVLGYSSISFFWAIDKTYFRILRPGRMLFVLAFLLNLLFFEGPDKLNAMAFSVCSLLIISICLVFFYKIYSEEKITSLEKSGSFWVAVGLLFYFSGAMYSFLLSADILKGSPDNFYNSWILHNISNTLKNILITVGLWCHLKYE